MEVFMAFDHRRRYRFVYNKFWYWFKCNPEVECAYGSACSLELWALAQADYHGLNKWQKNMVLRHFLNVSHAPDFVDEFSCRQWP